MATKSKKHSRSKHDHSSQQAEDKMREGAFHFALGNYEESIRLFSLAVEKDPALASAYLSRGSAYVKTGDFPRAEQDFEKATELTPGDARVWHFRGLSHLAQGEREKAKADFDKALEIDDRYGIAYFSRGTTRSELGDLDGAGDDMVMAARIGEANLQGFADYHNIWRTKYDKMVAELTGEREPDIAMTPDLTSWWDEMNKNA